MWEYVLVSPWVTSVWPFLEPTRNPRGHSDTFELEKRWNQSESNPTLCQILLNLALPLKTSEDSTFWTITFFVAITVDFFLFKIVVRILT